MNVIIRQLKMGYFDSATYEIEYLGIVPISVIHFTQAEYNSLTTYKDIIVDGVLSDSGEDLLNELLGIVTSSRGFIRNYREIDPASANNSGKCLYYLRRYFFPNFFDIREYVEVSVQSGRKYILYDDDIGIVWGGTYSSGTITGIYKFRTGVFQFTSNNAYLSDMTYFQDRGSSSGAYLGVLDDSESIFWINFEYSSTPPYGPYWYNSGKHIFTCTDDDDIAIYNFLSQGSGPTPGSKDIADCDIRVDPMSFIYDGQPKTPLVTVYSGLDILSEGTDYVKTYENNIYAGTAAVLVAGIGEYTGSQRVYFTISESGPPTTEFRVTLPKYSYDYTGEPVTPPVNVVTTNGTILTENTDYLKTYENNTNIGQASVLVAGINDYADFPSKRVYFNIVEPTPEPPVDTNWYVRLPKYSYDYTGDPITPLVTVTTYTGIGLIEGTDYIKTYQNNTLVGQASVLVVGQGDYSGTQIVYFNIVQPAPDPYSPIGPSGPSEGQGTFNPVSDTLPAYTLPTLNISNTGFTRIYNPTLSQVQSLASYMWTDPDFFQTLFNKLIQVFENPMDAIIAFNIVPCEIPDGGTEEFKVLYLGTGVNMTVAAQQYVAVDCGTVTISEFFGSALDYNPYTKIKCYLPYIGTIELDTDEVMNETLHLVYTIDIVSGACIAQIYINDIPVYQFSGHCAQYIPMAASDFSSYVSALIGISKIVAGAVAAGAGAGADSGAVMNANGLQLTGQTLEKTTQRNSSTGRQITTGTVATEQWSLPPTQASFASQVPGIIANTVGQVVGSKIGVAHTGTFSGASGFMAYANPFIRIERPRLVNPAEYSRFNGRPSMITRQLNQLSGYTVVQQVQLTGFTCTQPEMEEISTLLKGGVVF